MAYTEDGTCFPNFLLNLGWEKIDSNKCHRTQAVTTLMKYEYLFRILLSVTENSSIANHIIGYNID